MKPPTARSAQLALRWHATVTASLTAAAVATIAVGSASTPFCCRAGCLFRLLLPPIGIHGVALPTFPAANLGSSVGEMDNKYVVTAKVLGTVATPLCPV